MTLDEMLALLPDNSTGAIGADDLRAIVTALWDHDTALSVRVAELEASSGAGGGGSPSITGFWQLNPQVGTAPGTMQITADAFPLSDATWLRFAPVDQQNVDMTAALELADRFFIQQKQDSTHWARLSVAGALTDMGGYIEVPVVWLDGSGTVSQAGWQDVAVAITAASA